jgi:hypothetical protein
MKQSKKPKNVAEKDYNNLASNDAGTLGLVLLKGLAPVMI